MAKKIYMPQSASGDMPQPRLGMLPLRQSFALNRRHESVHHDVDTAIQSALRWPKFAINLTQPVIKLITCRLYTIEQVLAAKLAGDRRGIALDE